MHTHVSQHPDRTSCRGGCECVGNRIPVNDATVGGSRPASEAPHRKTQVLILHGLRRRDHHCRRVHHLQCQTSACGCAKFTETSTTTGTQSREQSSEKLALLTVQVNSVANCVHHLSGDHEHQRLVHCEKTMHVRGRDALARRPSPRLQPVTRCPGSAHPRHPRRQHPWRQKVPVRACHRQARQKPCTASTRETRVDEGVDCDLISDKASYSR